MMTRKTAALVIGIALWLPLMLFVASLQGCETGTTGVLRPIAPSVEHTITNVVTVASQTVAPALPFPWNNAAEAGGAAVLALLAAWQGLTHSRVKHLTSSTDKQNGEMNE
jgi:hypothetical protein